MSQHLRFAISLHPETVATSRPPEAIAFVGHPWPHFVQIRQALVERAGSYPSLTLRIAPLDAFASVHTAGYLQQILCMAAVLVSGVAAVALARFNLLVSLAVGALGR